MKPVIALPFTEMTVQVIEDPDPTCLLRIKGMDDARKMKQTVVGRKRLASKAVHVHLEDGEWTCINLADVPVVEVVSRE